MLIWHAQFLGTRDALFVAYYDDRHKLVVEVYRSFEKKWRKSDSYMLFFDTLTEVRQDIAAVRSSAVIHDDGVA